MWTESHSSGSPHVAITTADQIQCEGQGYVSCASGQILSDL